MSSSSEAPQDTSGACVKNHPRPLVLMLSGQSVFAESHDTAPLYEISSDVCSVSNKDASVRFERVEQSVQDETNGDKLMPPPPRRHLFYLVHPYNAQYRTDIPAKYYITCVAPEMIGNVRLEVAETRLRRTSFRAMLSAKRTASDNPLFHQDEEQSVLFNIRPISQAAHCRYGWSDSNGSEVATEQRTDGIHKLALSGLLSQQLRDMIVAAWLLRLWYDTAESRQAKKQFFESMASAEGSTDPYMKRQCDIM
ncbi:Uncharacterized protein PECH_006950 [Penicillium ucsense]|uniref:Uncharacterized protein n=1 Tax=Penicillium ucsense TaxID=2839758 RepID=A0A8J8W7U6_9EURO|nr:Uncharacterized protein PECM_005077 [Penicillium ucsense]KAF7738991.1 Uncharacterized protein PECH_006950 [Penicillium ucsense]